MLVEVRRLAKHYPTVRALDDIDLTLEPGIIGLVGANGAGKSTLIKILLGLLEPTSDSAEMMGLDVAKHGTDLRQHVGYLPEHDCLTLDMNATEFVGHMAEMSGLPRSAARERTAEMLRHVGLFEARYREMAGAPPRCGSASSSRGHSSTTPTSCSSTNRRTASIRLAATRCSS